MNLSGTQKTNSLNFSWVMHKTNSEGGKYSRLREKMNEEITNRQLRVSCCTYFDDMKGKFIALYIQEDHKRIVQWFDDLREGNEFANRWFISCFIKFNPGILKCGKFRPMEIGE